MSRRTARVAALTLAVIALGPASASAHEAREVGPLEIVVGFGVEPAYTGQPNSVQVIVSRDGSPVSPARGLEVDVGFGGATATFELEPAFDSPGEFRAPFIPSQPGDYTFRVTGHVEGERIDEEFTSGPDTFSPVHEASAAAFPPVNAPTNEDLATRIGTESVRTGAVERAAAAARAAASDARTVAVIGIVLGSIAVIAAIGALAMARRAPARA